MADTITISVKLFATLKRHLPSDSKDGVTLTLRHGATGQDVLAALSIPLEQAGMFVAGDTSIEADTLLQDGQELNIFPPLAGGTC
jgi:molybdopterin converting factor small subunit